MKKAQTGITLIIIMISSLFIGAIVAGVFITTQNDLQAKAKKTGDETRHDVSAIFFVMDIVGNDGSDGNIEEFQQLVKLPPGSDPVNMEYLNIVLSTENTSASLSYAGVNATTTLGSGGFNTWTTEELGEMGDYYDPVTVAFTSAGTNLDIDLDLDGAVDTIAVCAFPATCTLAQDGTYLQFNLSTAGLITVPILDPDGNSVDISSKNGEIYGNYLTPIGDYGYMSTSGTETAGVFTMEANTVTVFLAPVDFDEDLDADGSQDLIVIDDTNVIVHYSTNGDVWQQFNSLSGTTYATGVNLSGGAKVFNNVNITLTEADANPNYGTIFINGATSRASYIDDNVTFLVTPYNLNKGVFSASYAKKSAKYSPGVINDGDVVRLYYETPEAIDEDQEVHVTLITRSGGVTQTQFFMPNIINGESITIYPPSN